MAEEVILLHPPEVDVLNVWPSVGSSAEAARAVSQTSRQLLGQEQSVKQPRRLKCLSLYQKTSGPMGLHINC